VICVLHRQVLLVITGTHSAMNIASTQQLQQQRKIRNKNPNCNHNSNGTYYQPTYNNVKLDDSFKKKEETLRRIFLKDSPAAE
jgi:hypothetical protein